MRDANANGILYYYIGNRTESNSSSNSPIINNCHTKSGKPHK